MCPLPAAPGEHRAGASVEAGVVISAFAVGGLVYSLPVRCFLRVLGPGRMMAAGGLAPVYLVLGAAVAVLGMAASRLLRRD